MLNRRLLAMVSNARRYIALDVVLQWIALLAHIVLFILIGFCVQSLLDHVIDTYLLCALAACAFVALIVRLICQTMAQRMGRKAATLAKTSVRQVVYDKLVRMGPAYRECVSTSEAVQVSVEGAEQLEVYFGQYIPQLFYAIVAPITLFVCLAPLCLPAALVLLICVPFIPASIAAIQKIARRIVGQYWHSYTDLGGLFLESIQGLTTLKIFQVDERRHEEMRREAESFRQATMRVLKMQLNSVTIMDLFAYGGAAIGIVVTLFQLSLGQISFGTAFSIVFLSAEFFLPMRTLGSYFHTAMNGMAATDMMFEILDTPESVSGTRAVDPDRLDITCCQVGYSYDGERTVLSSIDLAIPQGSFVGITGESGSGKSTCAGILRGAYKNYTGTVAIGNIDMRDISQASLRETITYVSFSSYVFKGTIRSNLMVAKPNATDAELWNVLERCCLSEFVRASGGLDMAVAAEGGNLSGGQRQRLVMARALLHDTPIYIFDEATSNIDVESEQAILASVYELARDKTVIMISHRLAALRRASAIYVFEDGRIVETGSHDELCGIQGVYACLWREQENLEEFVTHDAAVHATQRDCVGIGDSSHEVEGDYQRDNYDTSSQNKRDDFCDDAAWVGKAAARRSHISVMFNLLKLTRSLIPVMVLAILLGIGGFIAAIFLTVCAVYGMLSLVGCSQGVGLFAAIAMVGVCGLLRGPLRYGEQLCNHYLAFKILALVRDQVFGAMRTLAPAKLEGRDKGDLVALITSDVELLEVFYAHTLSPVVIALLVSVIMIAFVAYQSVLLAGVVTLSYVLIGIVVPWISSKASGDAGRVVRDSVASLNTFVLDSLRGLSETLQFGRAADRSRELKQRMDIQAVAERSLKNKTAFSIAVTGCLVVLCDLVMLAIAFMLVWEGALEFGPALLSVAALMSSFGPVIAVANLGTTLQQTLASGARVLELLEESPCIEEVTQGTNLERFKGASVHRLDFSYGNDRVLSDVNISIEQGSIVRIAGRSGSGKSTLLKLLMRFWDPDKGIIELSGLDIRHINTASLRDNEGFMTQETYLFSGTIRDNVMLARPDASEEELMYALERAALGDLISRLPQGVDTSLGELGDTLSGGERQRMGLARIFLHDAPLLLLDEPTSNLDSLNEAAVLRALSQHRADKTIVLVSHRKSAAHLADVSYSIEHGRIS